MKHLSLLLVTALLTGCSLFSSAPTEMMDEEQALYDGTVTIGISDWTGYAGLYLADAQGYFAQEGVDVSLKDYGTSTTELSKEYIDGTVHGRANIALVAIQEALDGMDHAVVAVLDYSNGADALVAHKDIQTADDLPGKRVGFEHGSLEELFVEWILQERGRTLNDIVGVEGTVEENAQKILRGEIDAATLYAPFYDHALESDDLHIIYTSADAPGLITDVLTFRSDFVREYPGSVQAVVDAYFKGLAFLQKYPDQAHALLAKKFDTTPEDIALQLEGIELPDRVKNKIAFTFAPGFQSLYGNLRQVHAFVTEQRDDGKTVDTDRMIDKRFVQ
jgi:NitT/TauT family transport system substrate-binding protein